jgi:hypoxanthine phosphoribosyltransferase
MKQILFTKKEIQKKVEEIAHNINMKGHKTPPVFICVLNGAFMFFTDLVKNISECNIDFIRAKSYEGTTQSNIQITKSIEIDINGRDIYLVDDIYDTGNTMKALVEHLGALTPKSITPITLFKKEFSNHPDLIYGFELKGESWLIGYGLDGYKGLQRNLEYILGIPKED